MSKIILASGSPRRKELLEQIGLEFDICPAKGEEVITKELPQEVVLELSKQKAEEIASGYLGWMEGKEELMSPQDMMIIGADTVVAYDNQILGKPKDQEEAKRMLALLSGKTHSVYTGVTLVFISADGKVGEHSFFEKTQVTFCEMSEAEIASYVATGDPLDKAGSYGIQGPCAIYIKGIEGDYYNVVGLPIGRLYQELQKLGINVYMW